MELMVYINKTEFFNSLSKKLSWVYQESFFSFYIQLGWDVELVGDKFSVFIIFETD